MATLRTACMPGDFPREIFLFSELTNITFCETAVAGALHAPLRMCGVCVCPVAWFAGRWRRRVVIVVDAALLVVGRRRRRLCCFAFHSGQLPTEIGVLTNLQEIVLSQSQLTGLIPTEVGRLVNLKTFAVPYCHFSGWFCAVNKSARQS